MNIGIIICSRSDSKRVPNKPFREICGKPILIHLLDRLFQTGIPIYVAVPHMQYGEYHALWQRQQKKSKKYRDAMIQLVAGSETDPLKRTYDVAKKYGIDTIIRITHDKIFLDYRQINHFIHCYNEENLDYIYSTNFIDGMGFEIFDISVAENAHKKFKDVEHLSFALDAVAQRKKNKKSFPFSQSWSQRLKGQRIRLLIDYEKDVEYMERLLKKHGNEAEIEQIVADTSEIHAVNKLPEVTVYTCSYNDHEFLNDCMSSVLLQSGVDFEYLLVNDGSTDKCVRDKMIAFAKSDKRIRYFPLKENGGLSSASRFAVQKALGKYIIRLDSDDYFYTRDVLHKMLSCIKANLLDALYPDNIKGTELQRGYEQHHVGGALFRKRALDYVQFTEGLRHFEGLDLFERMKKKGLRFGYWHGVGFYYRQRLGSMSKDKGEQRELIRQKIASGQTGGALL